MIQIIPDGNWSLTQWDVDRYITINGLDELADTEIHIASDSDSYGAYVVLPESGDSGTTAVIPNIVLTYAGMVNIYVYQNKRTIYHTAIPVTAREKPDDYIYTPSEVDGYIRIKEEEAKRQAAEAMREATEAERAAAEADREVAEDEREAAEAERVAAEEARVKAEEDRANILDGVDEAEKARAAAESLRREAELLRASAETGRSEAESKRVTAETVRAQSEISRSNAEQLRANAETARNEAEAARVSAETLRDSAETARVTAESGRVTAESARATAEQERVIAEAERADRDTGIVAQATAAADSAEASATTAAEAAVTSTSAAANASIKAGEAAASAAEANGGAVLSESWAIGGTGTREGEDTNNAKYWSNRAEQIAGGDYAPRIHTHVKTDITDFPETMPPSEHTHSIEDITDYTPEPPPTLVEGNTNGTVNYNGTDVPVHGLGSAAYTESTAYDSAGSAAAVGANLSAHIADKANPHGVTAAQAGAAEAVHTHNASDITAGTLDAARLPAVPVDKGGTGAATADEARASLGAEGKHTPSSVTLTASGWSNNSQTISVSGMTATLDVVVSPAPDSYEDWGSAGVFCSAQGAGTLTFSCKETPSSSLTANLLILMG